MAYVTAILAALAATNIGLQASGTIKGPSLPGPPPSPGAGYGKGIGGAQRGGIRMGGVPFHRSSAPAFSNNTPTFPPPAPMPGKVPMGAKPMIGNMGNTGVPDVLGALSQRPTGGALGMLASGGSNGMGGMPMRGALSSGGIDPAKLQLILGGLNAGGALMGGAPVDQVANGFVNQAVMPAIGAMRRPPMGGGGPMGPGGEPPMGGGGPMEPGGAPGMQGPKSPEDLAAFLAWIKANGLEGQLQGGGGPMPGGPGAGGMKPYGMMGGYR